MVPCLFGPCGPETRDDQKGGEDRRYEQKAEGGVTFWIKFKLRKLIDTRRGGSLNGSGPCRKAVNWAKLQAHS